MADLHIVSSVAGMPPTDFTVRLDYEPNSENPSRIFQTMANLLEACATIDMDLTSSISIQITPILVLQDIQAGSLIARLTSLVKSIDDQALGNLDWKRIIGTYLVKGKRRLVEFLENRPTIRSAGEIYKLQDALGQAAEEAGLPLISLSSPVPTWRVAEDLRLLSDATRPLIPADSAHFVTQEGSVEINTSFEVTPEAIELVLTQDSTVEQAEMTLVVKKPDFLGDSMWDFRHEGRGIRAKVVDPHWLNSFRRGAIPLRSGDALQALVEIETNYGRDREVLGTHYKVLSVLRVIARSG